MSERRIQPYHLHKRKVQESRGSFCCIRHTNRSSQGVSSHFTAVSDPLRPSNRRKTGKFLQIRAKLRLLTAISAFFSLNTVFLGYFYLYSHYKSQLCPCFCCISTLQIVAVLLYSAFCVKLKNTAKSMLNIEKRDEISVYLIVLECFLHVFPVFLCVVPNSKIVFLLIFPQSYLFVRLIYWFSAYTTPHYHFYTLFFRCPSHLSFTSKVSLRLHSPTLLLSSVFLLFPLAFCLAPASLANPLFDALFALTRIRNYLPTPFNLLFSLIGCGFQAVLIVIFRHFLALNKREIEFCEVLKEKKFTKKDKFMTDNCKEIRVFFDKVHANIEEMKEKQPILLHKCKRMLKKSRKICVICFKIAKIALNPGGSHRLNPRKARKLPTIIEENSEISSV